MGGEQDTGEEAAPRIDTSVAHPARRYNYWLGGKDHFAADRESGDAVVAAFPTARAAALENRAFMKRAVEFLARDAGVRQFLDIGTGIPAPDNTHEVAQAIAPESRVLYVDNDPIVVCHARALLTGTDEGATAFVEADLRDYAKILADPALTATLDMSRPVALMLVAILHFVPDDHDPYDIVAGLRDALPTDSYLVVSHATADHTPMRQQDRIRAAIKHGDMYPRSREEFTRFFDGFELVEPGVVSAADWRADGDPETRLTAAQMAAYAAVGRLA